MEVWEEGDYIYLSLQCRHQNDSCIKMGSDDSHFNVSLIVRDKVTKQCLQTTTFEDKGEPKRIRTEVPLLTTLPARPNRLTHINIQKEEKRMAPSGMNTLLFRNLTEPICIQE